jgi:hypothetical protein
MRNENCWATFLVRITLIGLRWERCDVLLIEASEERWNGHDLHWLFFGHWWYEELRLLNMLLLLLPRLMLPHRYILLNRLFM